MARDDVLVRYVLTLAKRLRAQPRATVVDGKRVMNVIVLSADAVDEVAAKLEQLAGVKKKPPPRGK